MDCQKRSKWTIFEIKGRAKVDSPSKSGRSRTIVDDHESKDKSGQSKNVKVGKLKVDGLKVSKLTPQMY